jgi:hypothetical protein
LIKIALALATKWVPRLLGAVPLKVWLVLIGLVAMAYYADWNYRRGAADNQAAIDRAVEEERERVQEADQKAIDAAEERAREAERLAAQRAKELRDALIEAGKLPDGGDVCLPASVTDRLRAIQ